MFIHGKSETIKIYESKTGWFEKRNKSIVTVGIAVSNLQYLIEYYTKQQNILSFPVHTKRSNKPALWVIKYILINTSDKWIEPYKVCFMSVKNPNNFLYMF